MKVESRNPYTNPGYGATGQTAYLPQTKLIAFTGFGGCGKDEAGRALIKMGYTRRAFGDMIKADLDDVIKRRLGFSAFTGDRAQKALIRRTLESYGEDAYEQLTKTYFDDLPEFCVNTRLCRVAEAERWVREGGLLYEVIRPGVGAETERAAEWLTELRQSGLIRGSVANCGTVENLHARVSEIPFDSSRVYWLC